jgi:hypothetical protein
MAMPPQMIVAGGIVAGFYVDRILRTVNVHDPLREVLLLRVPLWPQRVEKTERVKDRGMEQPKWAQMQAERGERGVENAFRALMTG